MADEENKVVENSELTTESNEENKTLMNQDGPIKRTGHQDKPLVELTRVQFVLVFLSLALTILLAALDQTIVSTALPEIITVFKAADLISWVGTGYILTATAFAPIYGKLADIFGRKETLLLAVTIFEIGSAVCGAANSIEVLIGGRVIQGIGGGGIFSLVLIVISDIVVFQDRGKYQGIIGAVFGLASVIGPLAGGAFTDYLSWRWCFYINLPIGGVTLIIIAMFLRFPKRESTSFFAKLKTIDYLGFIIILGGVTALLLPIQLGGTIWPWDAWYSIFCFVLFGALLVVLFFVEWKFASEPIIPGKVFENITVYSTLAVAFCIGAAFLSVVYYIPTYFQVVVADNATVSGLKTIPFVVGIVFMSITSGIVISKTGRMQIFLFIGSIVLTTGISLLTMLDVDTPYWKIAIFLFICGLGVGSMIQTRVLALQAAVKVENIAVATSLSNFFQTLGGGVGIAVFGVVFTNKLYENLLANTDRKFASEDQVKALASAPNAIRSIVKNIPGGEKFILPVYLNSFVYGMRYALYAAIPFAAFIFILAFFVRHNPHQQAPVDEEKKGVESDVEVTANGDAEEGTKEIASTDVDTEVKQIA